MLGLEREGSSGAALPPCRRGESRRSDRHRVVSSFSSFPSFPFSSPPVLPCLSRSLHMEVGCQQWRCLEGAEGGRKMRGDGFCSIPTLYCSSVLPLAGWHRPHWWCGHFHGDVFTVFDEMGRRYAFFFYFNFTCRFLQPHSDFALAFPGCQRYEP